MTTDVTVVDQAHVDRALHLAEKGARTAKPVPWPVA